MVKKPKAIIDMISQNGCFDLQFRKDTRIDRTHSPTYYRWKAQFAVMCKKSDLKKLNLIKKILSCGSVSSSKNQARLSVQNINELEEKIIPFFTKNLPSNSRKKDFCLWVRAIEILRKNKGKPLSSFSKQDLNSLLVIHKASLQYKNNPRKPKWMNMAKNFYR